MYHKCVFRGKNALIVQMHTLDSFFEVSKSLCLTSPGKRGRPSIRHVLIFLVYIASISSLYDSFSLFLTGNAPLYLSQKKLHHLYPQPGI